MLTDLLCNFPLHEAHILCDSYIHILEMKQGQIQYLPLHVKPRLAIPQIVPLQC